LERAARRRHRARIQTDEERRALRCEDRRHDGVALRREAAVRRLAEAGDPFVRRYLHEHPAAAMIDADSHHVQPGDLHALFLLPHLPVALISR